MEEKNGNFVESFVLAFIVVSFVSFVLRLLFLPFRGVGWCGYVLGFLAVSLLLVAGSLEVSTFVSAKEVERIEYATVKVPKANIRTEPVVKNNVLGQAGKGIRLQPVYYAFSYTPEHKPDWLVVHTQGRVCYMHKSTLDLTLSKSTQRQMNFDYLFGAMVLFYIFIAWRCWVERKRKAQEAKLEYLGLSDRQLS